MRSDLADICLLVATWIIVIPVVTGTLRYGYLSKECRVIFYFTIVACATETGAYITRRHGINNMPLLHVYTVIEFVMLSAFFHVLFRKLFSASPLMYMAALFAGYSLINSVFIQKILSFNSYTRGIAAILLISYALVFLYGFFFQPDSKNRLSDPAFWISSGILVYFSGAFTLFILSNYILPMGYRFNKNVWALHALLSITMYLFITAGLWKSKTR